MNNTSNPAGNSTLQSNQDQQQANNNKLKVDVPQSYVEGIIKLTDVM